VEIGLIDFQGRWEGWETALSFSTLSTDRHFHRLLRLPAFFMRRRANFVSPNGFQTPLG